MMGVSVIIPVYNREKYVGEAIRSVLCQNYGGTLEVIVSDDGSTDRSLEIAASFGDQIRIIKKPKRCSLQGVSGARNRGIAAATQPYISFLDSDDFYLPDHLNRMAEILENCPNLGFAFSRMLQMKEQNGKRIFAPWTRSHISKKDIQHPVVSGHNIVSTNTFLFRREVFEKAGLFNETYSNGEDGDLWMRISELFEGNFVDHYGAVYRIGHGVGQLTDSKNEKSIRDCALKIFSSALTRFSNLPKKDRYRLFRLRLILAALEYQKHSNFCFFCALSNVALRHPFCTLINTINRFARRSFRNKFNEWKNLSLFIG